MILLSERTRLGQSADVPREASLNALTRAVLDRRARTSAPLFDLTVSNPTTADLPYDNDAILAALSSSRALVYEPLPLGLAPARAAAAATFGCGIGAERVAITASTSEAYAALFKVLCDPGDQILVPSPSYPLLSWLAAFEAVELVSYPLVYAGRWHVDLGALTRSITPRTRGIVLVNPNNPTGSYVGRDELEAMLDLGLPILSDEVFSPYAFGDAIPSDRVRTVATATRGLVFSLGGLSKYAALPQMKLGWIACGGAKDSVRVALDRLESVLDAYLSVGSPVQHGLAALLAASDPTRAAIARRTRENLATMDSLLRQSHGLVTRLDVEGGWYATLRVPAVVSDEDWALGLVRDEGVFVHPGYFFDMHRGAHLIVSLLTPEAILRAGVERILEHVARLT